MPSPNRAVRHGALTTALVLVVSALVAVLSSLTLHSHHQQLDRLTARATAQLTPAPGEHTVLAHWTLPDGHETSTTIPLAVTPPKPGTRTQIAYNPATPAEATVPGATLLAETDRAATGVGIGVALALLVLLVDGWLLLSRYLVRRRPVHTVAVRRIRLQRGLSTRSYLETEHDLARRWIPVHFDPILTTLPTPTEVRVHGNPRTKRLVAVTVGGTTLWPSGWVRRQEPRGRRTDNPATPDTGPQLARCAPLTRQLRSDLPRLIPAPLIGFLWAFLDNSGFPGWLAATALAATLALWLAATKGSDPT